MLVYPPLTELYFPSEQSNRTVFSALRYPSLDVYPIFLLHEERFPSLSNLSSHPAVEHKGDLETIKKQ